MPVKLDRFVRNSNTLNDLSNKVYFPNKTEDLNIHVFNMITEKKIKSFSKRYIMQMYIKNVIDFKKCNSNQKWNNDKKNYIWNPSTCNCVNGKYLASVIDDSITTYDEITKK